MIARLLTAIRGEVYKTYRPGSPLVESWRIVCKHGCKPFVRRSEIDAEAALLWHRQLECKGAVR